MHTHKKLVSSGFTLVELLIVIVIIAILAAITIVAYNGIQNRANDSRRMSDLEAMNNALALYKADNGSYPKEVPNPGASTWERSGDPGFLSSVGDYTNNKVFQAPSGTTYLYHTFPAGAYGCAASLGPYYVLFIQGMQAQTGGTQLQNACAGETLFSTATLSGGYGNSSSYYAYYGF